MGAFAGEFGGCRAVPPAGTGAQFLVRLNASRRPPVLRHLPDGSFTSVIGGVKIRVIAAEVTSRWNKHPPGNPATSKKITQIISQPIPADHERVTRRPKSVTNPGGP